MMNVADLPAGPRLDALVHEHVMRVKWDESRCRVCGWLIGNHQTLAEESCTRDSCCWQQFTESRADEPPACSTTLVLAWQVWITGLISCGTASIVGNMEDYGRGAITRGQAEEVVTVTIGDWLVTGPVCEAICRAALLACGVTEVPDDSPV